MSSQSVMEQLEKVESDVQILKKLLQADNSLGGLPTTETNLHKHSLESPATKTNSTKKTLAQLFDERTSADAQKNLSNIQQLIRQRKSDNKVIKKKQTKPAQSSTQSSTHALAAEALEKLKQMQAKANKDSVKEVEEKLLARRTQKKKHAQAMTEILDKGPLKKSVETSSLRLVF